MRGPFAQAGTNTETFMHDTFASQAGGSRLRRLNRVCGAARPVSVFAGLLFIASLVMAQPALGAGAVKLLEGADEKAVHETKPEFLSLTAIAIPQDKRGAVGGTTALSVNTFALIDEGCIFSGEGT